MAITVTAYFLWNHPLQRSSANQIFYYFLIKFIIYAQCFKSLWYMYVSYEKTCKTMHMYKFICCNALNIFSEFVKQGTKSLHLKNRVLFVDIVDINALCKYQVGPSQKLEDTASNMIDIYLSLARYYIDWEAEIFMYPEKQFCNEKACKLIHLV